jgi:bifunctional ADP-heptose synthase (sugar kinase/adenylyltransferase)
MSGNVSSSKGASTPNAQELKEAISKKYDERLDELKANIEDSRTALSVIYAKIAQTSDEGFRIYLENQLVETRFMNTKYVSEYEGLKECKRKELAEIV